MTAPHVGPLAQEIDRRAVAYINRKWDTMPLPDELRLTTIEGLRLALADLTADQLRHLASLDDAHFEQALGHLDN